MHFWPPVWPPYWPPVLTECPSEIFIATAFRICQPSAGSSLIFGTLLEFYQLLAIDAVIFLKRSFQFLLASKSLRYSIPRLKSEKIKKKIGEFLDFNEDIKYMNLRISNENAHFLPFSISQRNSYKG